MPDVLTAFDLNRAMVSKSQEVDQAIRDYQDTSEVWVQADRKSRIARAQSYLVSKGKTVAEREAFVDIECDEETFEERRWAVLRDSAKEALRARLAQLSALQSQATALREELKLARTDNYSGGS